MHNCLKLSKKRIDVVKKDCVFHFTSQDIKLQLIEVELVTDELYIRLYNRISELIC